MTIAPPATQTMPCGVISEGFSGQIRTECDAGWTPYITLPPVGPTTPSPYFTCSAPVVTLTSGGWAIIEVTVQPTAAAPRYDSGTSVFLTLWSGSTTLNPDPYAFNVTEAPVPLPTTFSLACQAVTETAYSETVTVSGFPPASMPWGTKLLGTCTLTALGAPSVVATAISTDAIANPVAPQLMTWSPVMALTESAALEGISSGPNVVTVTPTDGTATVWFCLVIPPTVFGTGPTTITFGAAQVDYGGGITTTLTESF
ncbi:MAG TPA: hypothetical protein VKY26_00415 [Actinomycetota bacterium]|nr:hypothetical protein [Actinomycetota bacterium]